MSKGVHKMGIHGAKKMKMAIPIALGVLLAVFIVCFFLLDRSPAFQYQVSVSNEGTQSLNVNMTVSVPLFSKKEAVFLYLGEKNVTVRSCTDSSGEAKETYLEDGVITIPVSRGSTTNINYDVPVSVPDKHGNRGAITDDYVVFDGDQTFLLPLEFYVYDEDGVKNAVRKIKFDFDFPKDWDEIVPFHRIENPQWFDIHTIVKNAYIFGNFDESENTTTGLNVYTLSGEEPEDVSGFDSLFAYYTDLFESSPSAYSIVLLPAGDGLDEQIMGGAGTATVAASFNPDLLRDWQLLAHRMFHAFYDNAAPYTNVHAAPNLWLNEGLATYYENLATDALSNPLKSKLDVDVNRQTALTFNQYLYMRLKEPFTYNFAPMDEPDLTSEAMSEFLHYTAAPLIVQAFENESVKMGNSPNALLQYCLKESAFEERYTAFEAAIDLLGSEAQAFCEDYLLGVEVPPLWDLKEHQPSSEEILESLNYIETLLGSWQQAENSEYPIDIVSTDELQQALETLDEHSVSLLSEEMESSIRKYCPELFALINEYYWKAEQKGFQLNDRDLRYKMFS